MAAMSRGTPSSTDPPDGREWASRMQDALGNVFPHLKPYAQKLAVSALSAATKNDFLKWTLPKASKDLLQRIADGEKADLDQASSDPAGVHMFFAAARHPARGAVSEAAVTMTRDDQEAVAACRKDFDEACNQIVCQYVPAENSGKLGRLSKFLEDMRKSLRLTDWDANDACQNTILAMCLNIPNYDPQQPFEPWLFTIAKRKIVDIWRRRGGRKGIREQSESQFGERWDERGTASLLDGIAGRDAGPEDELECKEKVYGVWVDIKNLRPALYELGSRAGAGNEERFKKTHFAAVLLESRVLAAAFLLAWEDTFRSLSGDQGPVAEIVERTVPWNPDEKGLRLSNEKVWINLPSIGDIWKSFAQRLNGLPRDGRTLVSLVCDATKATSPSTEVSTPQYIRWRERAVDKLKKLANGSPCLERLAAFLLRARRQPGNGKE